MSAFDRFGTRLVSVRDVRAPGRAVVATSQSTPPAGVMASTSWNSGNGQAMAEQYSAEVSVNNAYLGEEYAYRCVDKIANSLCSMPFRAGYNLEKMSAFNTAAPLAKFLGPAPGSPNPWWSPAMLWRYVAAQWTLLGKTAFAIDRDPVTDEILGLYPLAVQYLRPIPAGPRSKVPFVGYQWLTPGNPGYRTFKLNEIAYMWRPSLRDPLQPESVVEAAQLNISVLKMIEVYDYQFLKNNATPSTLITTKPFAEPEMRRAFRDQFVSTMTGYQNAGKTMFAEAGDEDDPKGGGNVTAAITVNRIGLTQHEAQQSETRKQKVSDVCVAFGVPLSVLADSSDSKFQNYDQDERIFWKGTMTELSTQLRDAVNLHVAPLLGSEIGWFDTSKIQALQPPKTFKPIDVDMAVSMNLLDRDEWRNDIGLPPAADIKGLGPVIYPYNTTTPAGTKVEEVVAPPVIDPTRPLEIPATSTEITPIVAARARRTQRAILERLDTVEEQQRAAVRETRAEQRHGGPDGHQHVPSGHVTAKTPAHQVKSAMETMMTTSLQSLFAEQAANAEARLGGRRGKRMASEAATNVSALFDATYWEKRTADLLEPFFTGLDELEPIFDVGSAWTATDSAQKTPTPRDAAVISHDITAQTMANLGIAMGNGTLVGNVVGVFDTSAATAVEMLKRHLQTGLAPSAETTLSSDDVQRALLEIHAGRLTADAAIAALTKELVA